MPLQARQRVLEHGGAVLAKRDIERFPGASELTTNGSSAFESGVDQPSQREMSRQQMAQHAQIFSNEPRAFGADLELEMG